jgi:hypothetical protein
LIGTHASINARHDEQTDPIDVDHPELRHSDTDLTEYGNSNEVGITGIKAFSANFPCQISLLFCHFVHLASHVLNGGKL